MIPTVIEQGFNSLDDYTLFKWLKSLIEINNAGMNSKFTPFEEY